MQIFLNWNKLNSERICYGSNRSCLKSFHADFVELCFLRYHLPNIGGDLVDLFNNKLFRSC